jgi:hypothetical protein
MILCFRQCCGSGMWLSRIPDPTFFHPGSRIRTVCIPDPGSTAKNLSILTQKKPKKWFLSSRKYDPGCSSRIRMLTFYPSRIPDPGIKKAPDPGSRIRIRNIGFRFSLSLYNHLLYAKIYPSLSTKVQCDRVP